jgi:hypothetical protein
LLNGERDLSADFSLKYALEMNVRDEADPPLNSGSSVSICGAGTVAFADRLSVAIKFSAATEQLFLRLPLRHEDIGFH